MYGLNSIAQVVAESSSTPLTFAPSNKLSELCFLGTISNDTTDEMDEFMVESAHLPPASMDTGLVFDTRQKYEPCSTPDVLPWYTSQHREGCLTAAFSMDGRYAATGSRDASIKVIDVHKVRSSFLDKTDEKPVIKTLYDHTAQINDVKFHPNGKLLASCSSDCSVKLYDLTKSGIKKGFRTLFDGVPINCMSFHPSGDFLLTGMIDNGCLTKGTDDVNIRLWDINTIQCFLPFSGKRDQCHTARVTCVQYAPLGQFFASGSDDGCIKIWDTVSGKCVNTLSGAHSSRPITSITFSRNGLYMLTSGKDSVGKLWDMSNGKELVTYEGAAQATQGTNFTFSQNEEFVMSSDELSFGIVLWDARSGDLLSKKPHAHGDVIRCIASSSYDSGIFSCSEDCRVKYWNISQL